MTQISQFFRAINPFRSIEPSPLPPHIEKQVEFALQALDQTTKYVELVGQKNQEASKILTDLLKHGKAA